MIEQGTQVRSDDRMEGKTPPAPGAASVSSHRYSDLFGAVWPPVLFLVLVIGAWEFVAPRGWILNPILLPTPHAIVSDGWILVRTEFFMENFLRTFWVIVVSTILAMLFGLVSGTLFAVLSPLRNFMYPYIVAFEALPKIVFVPIFLVIFGYGPEAKIVTAIAIAFFPVFINTMIGLSYATENNMRLMNSLTADPLQVFIKLRIPSALPLIFAGVKIAVSGGMTGVIAAELLAGTDLGIGRLIAISSFQLQMARVFALVFIIAVMAFALFFLVEWAGNKIVFWAEDEEERTRA